MVHYLDIYERHFERFRGNSPTVLEIGVSQGGSLEMWRAYFGDGARIVGIDIDPACAAHVGDGITVHIGGQTDRAFLGELVDRYGAFDIVIDDGSHRMRHTRMSFEILYPHVAPHGVYLVEDMHVAYEERFEGGLRREGTFVEYVKDRIDDLNAYNTVGALDPSDFTKATDAICVYDGVIVFERRPHALRQAVATGAGGRQDQAGRKKQRRVGVPGDAGTA